MVPHRMAPKDCLLDAEPIQDCEDLQTPADHVYAPALVRFITLAIAKSINRDEANNALLASRRTHRTDNPGSD